MCYGQYCAAVKPLAYCLLYQTISPARTDVSEKHLHLQYTNILYYMYLYVTTYMYDVLMFKKTYLMYQLQTPMCTVTHAEWQNTPSLI